jgi:uncharacterized protein (TIGR02611 family)
VHSGVKHHERPFRAFFRRNRMLNSAYRTAIAVSGGVIVVAGILLIPLPGPGWLIVFAGLAVLSTEFAWAGRLLTFVRDKVVAWTAWVTRQPLWMRMLIGLAGVALLAGLALAYIGLYGVPEWLPIL